MATNNLLSISDANGFPSDEEHEKGLIKTNVLYRVNCTSDPPELVLRDDMSGRILSANLMDNSQVCFIYHSVEKGGGGAVCRNRTMSGFILSANLMDNSKVCCIVHSGLFESRLTLSQD